ncbi:MAG: ABC-2 transporter permease, partial [Atopobiaceae bacterium]|nr:ABC-2 transporter permease [Atopobiaceae bacterium]
MKALFYADWCTLRKSLVSNIAVVLLVSTPAIFLSTSSGSDVELAPGVMVCTMIVSMLSFFAVINVFAADETGEWEKMRLTFPFSKGEVVRSRYLFLVMTTAALA